MAENASVHPLLSREIHSIRSWNEFLFRWQEVKTSDEMNGLLHVGFSIPFKRYRDGKWEVEEEYDEVDRLEFYFSIANGWADYSLLRLATDDDGSDFRRTLATKAFTMLCQNFFKAATVCEEGSDCGFEISRGTLVTSERLLPIIKNFFRLEKASRGIFNLSRIHDRNYQLAKSFLLNLVKFIWLWERVSYSLPPLRKEEIKKERTALGLRLASEKVWTIEVLERIGRLDLLEKLVLKFDNQCLAKLEEIALRECFYDGSTHRQVVTLDEACFAESAAAWLIKKHELAKMVKDKLQKSPPADR